jgi:flavin-dependent dehydrogenase
MLERFLHFIGDAAGLATKDMGEGIGPAMEIGILAAESNLKGQLFSIQSIGKYSLPGTIFSR